MSSELQPSEVAKPGPRLDTLAESVVILLVMTVVQRLIGLARGVLFCRWLELEQLGQWDVSFSFLTLAAPLAVLGLPGSFGRYIEHYRQRGELRLFLVRTIAISSLAGLGVMLSLIGARGKFSDWIFHRGDLGELVVCLALSLVALAAHNFLGSLFIAARMYRVVNCLQFFQSLGFAAFSLLLLMFWRMDPVSVVAAFGFSCFLTSLASLPWLRKVWNLPVRIPAQPSQGGFWSKIAPFAAWMWITNLVANLFEVADRYLIVHFSGMELHQAWREVGQYHSSRIIPLLLVGVAGLLGSMVTPHLSHDWEAGRRRAVIDRMNLMIKGVGLGFFAVAAAVLVVAPVLFEMAFRDKLSQGLSLLPWTLTYCIWFSLFAVAQNYLWCAEKAKLGMLSLLAGLLLNIGLNLGLTPAFGLIGAVWATMLANFVALVLLYALSYWHGMRFDRGSCILSLTPLALCGGPWAAAPVLAALTILAICTTHLFDAQDKQRFAAGCLRYVNKLGSLRRQTVVGVEATNT